MFSFCSPASWRPQKRQVVLDVIDALEVPLNWERSLNVHPRPSGAEKAEAHCRGRL
jgi:hypothetical protein